MAAQFTSKWWNSPFENGGTVHFKMAEQFISKWQQMNSCV
jgi:hypothetical protein